MAQVITRHSSEVDIRAARWLPCGPTMPQLAMQIMTCGRESVRTLRLKVTCPLCSPSAQDVQHACVLGAMDAEHCAPAACTAPSPLREPNRRCPLPVARQQHCPVYDRGRLRHTL